MTTVRWCDDDGRPLPVAPVATHPSPVGSDRSIWRHRAVLPVPHEAAVSLGEGGTPLLPGPDGVWLKCDHVMPSGSFKDRGASVLVSHLRRCGIDAFFLDSSGNAGAAMAMYAAAAGLRCEVLVPATTPEAKTAQARAHGARVTLIAGDRAAVAAEARSRAATTPYASHNWHPAFVHGTKTIAYELWEQMGGAPDHVVIPVGYGSSLLGCAIGFEELRRAGMIDRLPRLHAAQAAACAPLHRAHRAGADDVTAVAAAPTVAGAVAAGDPVRGRAMLAALRSSGGTTAAIDEPTIAAHRTRLAHAGFHVEPSSAVAAAGAAMLRDEGIIGPEERTVVLLTGTGLKA